MLEVDADVKQQQRSNWFGFVSVTTAAPEPELPQAAAYTTRMNEIQMHNALNTNTNTNTNANTNTEILANWSYHQQLPPVERE